MNFIKFFYIVRLFNGKLNIKNKGMRNWVGIAKKLLSFANIKEDRDSEGRNMFSNKIVIFFYHL